VALTALFLDLCELCVWWNVQPKSFIQEIVAARNAMTMPRAYHEHAMRSMKSFSSRLTVIIHIIIIIIIVIIILS